MAPVSATLLLALVVPAAPAPKAEPGFPKELIDLLPEDAVAVVIADVRRVEKSEWGKAFIKAMAADQPKDEPIRVDDLVRDVELMVIGQFLIDSFAGDFCVILRLREGAGLPKALLAQAEKGGEVVPEKIGKHNVYSIKRPHTSFTHIDDRTLMVVQAMGNEKQTKETRAAAYGDREKPGPSTTLRKMLSEEPADVPAIRVYAHHATKLAMSASLAVAIFGTKSEAVAALGDNLVSYRGHVKLGETADVTVRVTCRDADTAKALLAAYDDCQVDDPAIKEFRPTCKAVRDGEDVIFTGKAARAMIDRMTTRPNK